jgi:AcrR family transcriptional regulator
MKPSPDVQLGLATGRCVGCSPVTARRTQTERRAASERTLLDAAARLIAERGTAKTSFAEIAAAAGCSHGHPHYLFGTKARMLEALVARIAAQFGDEVRAGGSPDVRGLEALSNGLFGFIFSLEDPGSMTRTLYVLLGESLGAAPELRPALNDYHRQLRTTIAAWIAEGIEDGEIRPQVDAVGTAALVVGLVRGIGLQVLTDPGAFDLKTLARDTVSSVEQNLRA